MRRLLAEKHEVVAFDKRKCSLGTQIVQGDIATFHFDKVLIDIDVVFHLASLLGTASFSTKSWKQKESTSLEH